ncbi:MAG: O-antigen ligase family protein [Elusimicrobia bacterium]|nr:O-antigen ligase family protein [Elusimicrobiota bacterium]
MKRGSERIPSSGSGDTIAGKGNRRLPQRFRLVRDTVNSFPSSIDRIGSWGIALLGLAVSLSIAATHMVWIPLAVTWFGGRLLRRPGFRWCGKPLGWPSLSLGLVICLSGVIAGVFLRSLRRLRSDINWLVCFLVASVPPNREVVLRGFRWFLCGSLLTAALGLLQCGIGIVRIDSGALERIPATLQAWPPVLLSYLATMHRRAVGTRSHPLTYAEGLLFAWGLLLALWLWRQGWRRFWAGVGVLVVGAALVWSKGRGPWFAALGILGVGLGLEWRRIPWRGLAVFLVIMGVILWHPQIRMRIKSIGDFQEGSHVIRINLWQMGWRIWRDHPWWGVGPGQVKRFSQTYSSSQRLPVGEWSDVHNLYLQRLMELGIVGFGVFFWFLVTVLIYLAKTYWWSRNDSEHAPWFQGAFLGVLGCLLAGFTETTLGDSVVLLIFSFIVGSAMALRRCLSHEPSTG